MVLTLGKVGLLVSFVTSVLAQGDGVNQQTLLASAPVGPTASVNAGTIIGTTAVVTAATATVTINQYLGIPYAVTPPERFSAPKPANPFNASLVAQQFKPACLQHFKGKQ